MRRRCRSNAIWRPNPSTVGGRAPLSRQLRSGPSLRTLESRGSRRDVRTVASSSWRGGGVRLWSHPSRLSDWPRQTPVLLVTWSHSHYCFAIRAPSEKTEAILHGMTEAFAFFSAVPQVVWWDNPKTVAQSILTGAGCRLLRPGQLFVPGHRRHRHERSSAGPNIRTERRADRVG